MYSIMVATTFSNRQTKMKKKPFTTEIFYLFILQKKNIVKKCKIFFQSNKRILTLSHQTESKLHRLSPKSLSLYK